MPILVLARFGPKLASLAPFALAINLAAAGAGSAQSAPDAPSVPSETELLIEIRDAIRAQKAG